MCQGTARARRVSGAIRDGRWSKNLSCCLWRGNSVPLSLTEAPTAPQYQGDKTDLQVALGDALQGARCPFPMSLVLSHPPLACPQSHHHPSHPQSSAEQDGWDWGTRAGLRGTGWDRQLAEPLSAGTALSHPRSTIPQF